MVFEKVLDGKGPMFKSDQHLFFFKMGAFRFKICRHVVCFSCLFGLVALYRMFAVLLVFFFVLIEL